MIGMAAFFIRHEHVELFSIREKLSEAVPVFVALGILLTFVYVLFQGLMYVHSFKAIRKEVPLFSAIALYLKRNFVSVFLPAGGFSSLAFFTRDLEKHGPSKSQIHLASTLFGFFSILSVLVVAIPGLLLAFLKYDLQLAEILGFVFLLLLTAGFVYFFWSISRKGKVYHWLSRVRPSVATMLDEMISHKIERKQLWLILGYSIGIEIIGVVHLYIAMLALGLEPSIMAAFIGYIVMVILLIASPFLRGLGAIEVSLTFILGQFGYPVLAGATITLLFRFFEFWLPLLMGLISFFTRKDNLLLRILPAFIILILGVVNIISAITPAIPTRMRLMKNLLPAELVTTSNVIVLVFGLLLVIISVFLLKGSRRAWYTAMFLTLSSVIGHIIKAADYEEATLALIAALVLLYTRRHYKLKPHPKLTRISYQVLAYSIVAVLAYGVIGFYFIDKKHFGFDFQFFPAVKTVLKLFFLLDDSGLTPRTRFAHYFLHSFYISGAAVLCFCLYSLLKPYFSKPYNEKQDFKDADAILCKYGHSALDYFKTYPDKLLFFNEDRTAFLSFKITRHFAVVLENPVAADAGKIKALIRNFDNFCDENGFVSIYYRIPGSSLAMYAELGKKSLPIGEEAILGLKTFSLEGNKMKTTRSAINRLTAEGYSLKVYQPPIKEGVLQKLELVSNTWLKELDQKEVAFTQGVFDKVLLKEQVIITVEDQEEKVHAFLNIIPDYAPGETTYDLIRKVGDAPNGVLDMLLAQTFLYLKSKDYKTVNLGLAPLSGIDGIDMKEKTIRYAYENLKAFGHFKGLRKYKDKFLPQWEKKYIVYSHDYHLLQVPQALKRVSEGS